MVPNGWEACTLAEITKWSSGGTPSKSNPDYWGGDIPWISASSMRGHYYTDSDLKITELAVSGKAKMANKNDILLLVRGSMLWNKIPVGITTRKVAFNQDVKRISPILDKLNTEFLLYWFLAKENKLMGMVTGTGIGAGKLDTDDLQNLDVLLPSLVEQQKIAKVLSTWDKAISTTERLIDNSTQQKKALMQQLLTGKKRLLDESGERFEGDWEELRLENVFKLSSGDTKPKDVENEPTDEQKIPVFGGNNIMGYSANSNSEGDVILIGRVGEYCGVTRLIQEKCWITDNALFTKEFSNDFDRLFIVYLLQNFQLSRLRNKGGQPQISQKPIYNLKIKIPLLKEQQKIATVLTNADKEIELLEQQLADLQQEKKALMQVLLTGKKRVVIDEDNL